MYSFYDYITDSKRTRAELETDQENNFHMLLGMLTELGEMSDAFKKNLAYKKPLDWVNVQEELGDLMWYVAGFCEINDLDFYAILRNNVKKLKTRYPEKFNEEDAINRNLDKERIVLEELSK